MIVQRSIVGWSQWTQVTLSNWNEQRQPASDLVHQAAQGANFISIYSQRCKIRWSSKEECTEGLQFCHSINLTEAQRKAPIEFQFGKKCSLPGSFQYYPEEKHVCFQVWKAGTSLYEFQHTNAEEADQSKDQFKSVVDSEAKTAEGFSKYGMFNPLSASVPSYWNQSIGVHSKSIDWFLYEGNANT